MGKSVLVIDTPENCGKCKFISGFWCRAMGDRRVPNNDAIPGWCPLKPLPEEKEEEYWRSRFSLAWIRGWNTCISKIKGGNADG